MLQEPQELSDEQIAKIREIFMLFDQNGDETITNNELGESPDGWLQTPDGWLQSPDV